MSISRTDVNRDFRGYLEDARARIDRALRSVLDEHLDDVGEWLGAPIRYACEGGGKRFRPVLFAVSYRVAGGIDVAGAERLAAALEIVHSYSLVHDDLPCMDDDDWRRGRPTCHRAFGAERAVLAAAAMVPLASRVMAAEAARIGLTAEECAELVAELSRAAGPAGMVGGQLLDLAGEGRAVGLEEVREIHRRKTGALICAAARLGARAARAEPGVVAALTAYGERVGLAFQIADDLLDEIEERGRVASGDRSMDKATYPALIGPERAHSEARRLVEEGVAILRSAGIRSGVLEGLAAHVVERER